jgi:hypothetical protein
VPVSIRRFIIPVLTAGAAFLVSAVVAVIIFWAKERFYFLDPGAFVLDSPTISRAISDPRIEYTFAFVICFAAILLAFVSWRIVELHLTTFNDVLRQDTRRFTTAKTLIVLAGLAEAVGIIGMVSLCWLFQRRLHIGSSYLFFFGQATAIFFSGLAGWVLLDFPAYHETRETARFGLSPKLVKWRFRCALAIAGSTLLFWALFLVRDQYNQAPYWLDRSFSTLEMILIGSFLIYCTSYSSELFRAALARRHSTETPIPVRALLQPTLTIDPAS